MDNADVVEEALARQFRPLVDQVLSIVFYDLTTVRIHGKAKSKLTSAPMHEQGNWRRCQAIRAGCGSKR